MLYLHPVHILGRCLDNLGDFHNMAKVSSLYNTLDREYPVKLEPTEAQLTLFDNHQRVDLDFPVEGVKTLYYIPKRVISGVAADKTFWVHWHSGVYVS